MSASLRVAISIPVVLSSKVVIVTNRTASRSAAIVGTADQGNALSAPIFHGSVKLAVMLLRGCDLERGARLLDQAHGRLRTALALIGRRGTDAA